MSSNHNMQTYGSDLYVVLENGSSGVYGALFSFNCQTLSITENIITNKLIVFPNPSSDYIKISSLIKASNYKIYNQLGTEITRGVISPNEKININHLANGLYFLKIEKTTAIKFIKNK